MNKMKILIITTSGLEKKEGISTVILDYFSLFDLNKFELDIVASGNCSSKLLYEFRNIGFNIQFLPSRKNNIIKYIFSLINLFKKRKYDAIYIHGSSAIMSIELIIAKLSNCEIRIVHSHNTTCDHKKIDKILRPVFYNLYTHAFACGKAAGEWLYGKNNFVIIKNGRNIKKYMFNEVLRENMRDELNIDGDTLAIGHVGNFNDQKNHRFLIHIFKELILKNEKSKLFLIGTGENEDDIKCLVNKLGLSNYVVFMGSIDYVPDLLQAMDVMVLPSLYEGLPLVVIEWQIAALPCLISDMITKECAYTNLVEFKSLNDSYLEWAKEILKLSNLNRLESSESIIAKTRYSGYDIETNAKKLQKFFLEQFE